MPLFKNKIVLLVLLVVGLWAFMNMKPIDKQSFLFSKISKSNPQKNSDKKNPPLVTRSVEKESLVKTYYGILPCDDCDGVETTLVLTVNQGLDGGTYKLIEKYIGRGNASLELQGDWTASEGLTEDPDAEIIVIDPEDEEAIRGFYILSEDQIEDLDEYGNRFNDPEKHRLTLE